MPLAYIFLGAAGSGRREILSNLISDGLDTAAGSTACFLSDEEPPSEWDETLHGQIRVSVLTWRVEDNRKIVSEPVPKDVETVFFLTDGRSDPADQIEALRFWIEQNELEVGRILTVINCNLVHTQPKSRVWYDACIHFSDVVLLNRRSCIPGGWIREFTGHYEKACFPCLFENVRKGRLANPAEALFPEARRLSLAFDERDSFDPAGDVGNIAIEGDFAVRDEDDLDDPSRPDPYLETLPNGQRAKHIPDIRQFLDG